MSNKPTSSAKGITWDLKDLYCDPKDPALDTDLKVALQKAKKFENRYRGKLTIKGGITPSKLFQALEEFENICEKIGRVNSYANLLHAANTEESEYGALLQSVRERSTAIRKHLIFFELEWLQVSTSDASVLINSPETAQYKHYLEKEFHYRPHRLSELEEKILDEKANSGSRAFVRLFDEILSASRFQIEVEGVTKEMNQQQVLALLYHQERKQRRLASDGFTQGLKRHNHLLTYIFNILVLDHKINDSLRAYNTPMTARNLSNEIDQDVVQTLLSSCESGFDIVHRFYRFKAQLLGLKKLYDYDRYAPLFPNQSLCNWSQCKDIVEESFRQFDQRYGRIVQKFFTHSWIDAEIRLGKRGGAFSSGTVPSVHPYILVNYNDRLRDVMTVAHELGHGVHQYLSRKVGYLQSHAPLILAETASVFAEMIVFNQLMNTETDPKVRLGLLCHKLEDTFATIFRQVVLTRFEQNLHKARREEGELTTDQIDKIWIEVNSPMYGDSVYLTENYSHWWMYIPHFIHSPFYCYSYAFGELLALALLQKYRKQGGEFIPQYFELLSAGGSETPSVLLSNIGVDITDPKFYQGGIQILRQMLDEAEKLAKEI